MSDALLASWQAVLEAAMRWLPVVAVAALAALLARRRPARERHVVWLVALASLAALPFAGGRLPLVSVWVPAIVASEEVSWAAGEVQARSDRETVDRSAPPAAREPAAPGAPGSAVEGADRVPSGAAESGTFVRRGQPVLLRLGAVWIAVALLMLICELLSLVLTGALSRGARELRPEELPAGAGTVGRTPAILSGGTEIPILFGVVRPRILLPADWASWPETWLRAVILHERAHAVRHDVVVLAVARLVRAVFWFHPAAWVVVRALRREAEQATDERVLEQGMDRFEYADALLGLARHLGGRRIPLAGIAMAAPVGIRKRLLRIIGTDPQRIRRPPRAAALASMAPVVFVAVAAAAPPWQMDPATWIERTDLADGGALWRASCPASDTVCARLTAHAAQLLGEVDGGGIAALQDVTTGRVVAYAFVDRDGSRPSVPAVSIAAVAGLPLAAAWWEAGMGDRSLPCPANINLAGVGSFANTNGLDTGRIRAPVDVLAMQCATAAIAMGWYLAGEIRPSHLRDAFTRWGFAAAAPESFWAGDVAPAPASPSVPPHGTGAGTWILAGSVHGTVQTTPLHVTRFLQAVANRGRMITPAPPAAAPSGSSSAWMDATTAERLLDALSETAAGSAGTRIVGIVGPGLATATGGRGEMFAGLLLEGARPRYAVAVWLAGASLTEGADAPAGAARALAHQLLIVDR